MNARTPQPDSVPSRAPRAARPTAAAGVAAGNRPPADQFADPAARADARRNRVLVLAAAQRAFAERGTAVSLAEIARRAGVGAGTVHRHFPTKNDLLQAVLQQRVDRLTELALHCRESGDPEAGFFDFCAEVVTSTPANKALCDVFESDDGWPRSAMHGSGARFHHAVADLLATAQRQGAVRPDLTLADVLDIFTGCVAMQRSSRGRKAMSRPVTLLLDAMRAEGAKAAVTKLGSGPLRHNETPRRNETIATRCPVCAAPVPQTGNGRPARYCSAACRQKAHRQRNTTVAGAVSTGR
ncbi:helix-turn-helix transcriptional regulator [Nocardia sp. 2]|uniref:Helix-turn-helix transcriptional regulator n=1 Tax=Nocardia acididurans TaxID=2802282 RepID=A0ABS1MER2_9NOCA|nr:TetR/AcrR family transcriptional regulator [Nocardia acididurans]MBL1079113.1 helix-turn-helix transcriptional regulator [Nocardia acididurans]